MSNPLQTQTGGDHYRLMKIQPVEFIHANGIPMGKSNTPPPLPSAPQNQERQNEMKITDAELNKRIAEKCGWIKFFEPHRTIEGMGYWMWRKGNQKQKYPPDYTTDLNACHEMEAVICSEISLCEWEFQVRRLIAGDKPTFEVLGHELMRANARQRAIAFALTLGLVTKEEV